jgi:hypothetical protein
MSVRLCRHLRENGFFCKSPALNGRDYCYFHLNLRGRRLSAARARRTGENRPLNLPFPEDAYSIQICLHEIMLAVAEKRIDRADAATLLYSLQQASTNLRLGNTNELFRIALPSDRFAGSCPDFEQLHQLPPGIDLSVDPELAWSDLEPEPGAHRKPPLPARLAPVVAKVDIG